MWSRQLPNQIVEDFVSISAHQFKHNFRFFNRDSTVDHNQVHSMLEFHGDDAHISIGILILLIVVGNVFGYLLYGIGMLLCNIYQKRKSDNNHNVLLDPYSDAESDSDTERISLIIPDGGQYETESIATGNMIEYELTFNTVGHAVEIYSNALLDKMMNIPGFKRKVNESNIICHIIGYDEAEIQIIINHRDNIKNDPAIKLAMQLLKNEERVTNIKVNVKNIGEFGQTIL